MGGGGGKSLKQGWKQNQRSVYNVAKYWKEEGEEGEAGGKGRNRGLGFMEQAMELDGREAELADPSPFKA